ncbi:MAG: hypothetical protein K2V38_29025 [Gemmataceae bacterium]|nr:hypothetical protein [Gemmataceae bacterium]
MVTQILAAVLRFRRTLDRLRTAAGHDLCSPALESGYSDQSQTSQELQAFGGYTPTTLRKAPGKNAPHV